MSILELIIANLWVRILDLVTYGLKIKSNKITYISYTSSKLPENMQLISENIKRLNRGYEEVYLTIKYSNTIMDKFKYVLEIAKQIYHIKTSSVVIIDGNNFVVSNIDKKDTKVIQIWHACGAIKKFGNDYERKYKIKNYDYILTSSSTSKENFSKAFGVDIEQVIPLGCARTDILFNKSKMEKYKKEIYKKYPELETKKVILYAPTFRGNAVYEKKILNINMEKISSDLGDDYIILYKLHPIINDYFKFENKNIKNVSKEQLYKLFSVTDILVSDFSAIIYDFSILEKPIVLYAPDLENYINERGLYVNYEEFAPGKIAYTEDELVEIIISNNYDVDKVKMLKYTFFDYLDGKSAYRIARFIEGLIEI